MITFQEVLDVGAQVGPYAAAVAVGSFLQKFLGVADFLLGLFKSTSGKDTPVLNDILQLLKTLNDKLNGVPNVQTPTGLAAQPKTPSGPNP